MQLIQESFQRLFPKREFPYQQKLEYNRRLAPFNANILLRNKTVNVHLNLQWKGIDNEIKIGLIQHLLLRVLKKKGHTTNIDLYNNFIKNVHLITPKTDADPHLEASFSRVNQLFFYNDMEQPNLRWGQAAFRKLAHYNFHDDSVIVSSIFKDVPQEILDFLMYHELLHKQFKFDMKNGRSRFHSREFREAEALYPRMKEVEQEITKIVRKKRRKQMWKVF